MPRLRQLCSYQITRTLVHVLPFKLRARIGRDESSERAFNPWRAQHVCHPVTTSDCPAQSLRQFRLSLSWQAIHVNNPLETIALLQQAQWQSKQLQ
jgi:hypothetical protein